MRAMAVVAWREIVEHRMFLAAALAALGVTVVVPLVPISLGWSAADVREVLMWAMTFGFTWLSALFLGASMVTGPVAGGRFGFFLARPAGSAAIWFGKLIGVLTLVWLGELLILIPSTLLTYGEIEVLDAPVLTGLLFGVPLLLVLLAHGVATLWRAGTAWIALDIVALVIVGGIAWLAVGSLLDIAAAGAAMAVGLSLVAALMVGLTAAGAVQVAAGRSDRRRQRRAFSAVLWLVLLVSVAAGAAASQWLASPRAEDLTEVEDLVVQPAGRWVVVSGPARGRFDVTASYAIDLERGTSVRLDVGSRWWSGAAAAFSPDGTAAAWPVRDGDSWRIRFGQLGGLPEGAADSMVFLEERPQMVLSPSGSRTATIEDGTLVVTELASGDLVGSVRLPIVERVAGRYFVGEDLVRVVTEELAREDASRYDWASPRLLRALELDLAGGGLREVGTLADAGSVVAATLDGARDRLLLRMKRGNRSIWRYVDAGTLDVVDWSEGRDFAPITEMLADGRLVRLTNEGDESWLERMTVDGEIDGRVRLPAKPTRAVLGFQPTPSTIAIAVCDREVPRWPSPIWQLLLADLDSGRVVEIDEDSAPVRWQYGLGAVTTPLPAGSPAARLYYGGAFSGRGPSLWLWDPETGDKVRIVGRSE